MRPVEVVDGYKPCSCCKRLLRVESFHRCRAAKSGYAPACRACLNPPETAAERTAYSRNYRRANQAACLAKERAWRERNVEHVKQQQQKYGKVWYAKNKARLKPIRLEAARRWAAMNPHVVAAYAADRRARKKRATPPWANHEAIKAIYAMARDLSAKTGKPWHVDHEVPLEHPLVCGLHCEANLCPLPGRLNASKGNRWWIGMP